MVWRRRSIVLLSVGLFLLAGFVLVMSVGYSGTGEVQDPRDLPEIGTSLPSFDHAGSILYHYMHHPHGMTSYAIWASAPRDGVEALCDGCGLEIEPWGGESVNGLVKLFEESLNADQQERFGCGLFGHQDILIRGGTGPIQDSTGAYREEDGAFFLHFFVERNRLP